MEDMEFKYAFESGYWAGRQHSRPYQDNPFSGKAAHIWQRGWLVGHNDRERQELRDHD